MPIYVYRCDDCSEVHEALQKLSDAPLRSCPACGHEALRKVMAPAGIIFKGSGFHKNDYASSGGRGRSSESPKSAHSSEAPKSTPPSDPKAGTEKKAGTGESKVA